MYLFELWFSLDICPGVGSLDHICTAALAKIGPKWKKSQILTKKGMNKYTVAYPQNGIVYGNPKNQTNNAVTFVNFSNTMLSERSQNKREHTNFIS